MELNKLDKEIENKQHEIKHDKLKMTLVELASMYSEGELIIKSDFKWDKYQKTRFIETILLGLPIPPICVVEDNNGKWELIDGLQRLSTVFSFLGKLKTSEEHNNWKMIEGDILKETNNVSYDDLSPRSKKLIRRYTLQVEIIYYNPDFDVRYEILERLNTELSNQELRTTIYCVQPSEFSEFLSRNGNDNSQFLDLIQLPNDKIEKLYPDDLVLRFSALYSTNILTKNLKGHLNSYMSSMVRKNIVNDEIATLESILKRTLTVLNKIDEKNIFYKNGFSLPSYDGIMIGLARNIEKYENNVDLVKSKINELKNNDEFFSYTDENVMKRIKIADEIFYNP